MRDPLLLASIASVWGFSFLLMRWSTLAFDPLTVAGWRVAGGCVALLAVAAIWRRSWRPRADDWSLLTIIVLFGYLVPFSIQPWLIARHDTSFVGVLPGLVPLATILISLVVLRTRPTRRQLVGVIGGLVCLAALSADGIERAIPPRDLLIGLAVPASYALANTLVKRRFAGVPVVPFTAWCLGLSAVALLPLGILLEPVRTAHLPASIAAVAALGMISTGIILVGFYSLIQRNGPLYASMVTYLVPLGALFWGWAIGERISLKQIIAVAGIILMVVVTNRRPPPAAAPTTAGPALR